MRARVLGRGGAAVKAIRGEIPHSAARARARHRRHDAASTNRAWRVVRAGRDSWMSRGRCHQPDALRLAADVGLWIAWGFVRVVAALDERASLSGLAPPIAFADSLSRARRAAFWRERFPAG